MLSIIITHYKTPVLLKLCLKSILENIGNLEYEIIIVDSQSESVVNDLIEEKFSKKQSDGIKLISFPENVGYAKLVNTGIKSANGENILILNADILVLKGTIQTMVDFMQAHPQVGIIGPQLLTFSNQIQNSFFSFPTVSAILARRTFLGKLNWGRKKLDEFLIDTKIFTPQEVDWVQGSAMFVRKQAIEKVGLMDERYFMYLEDTDWCRCFWQNGYEVIYLPEAKMSHYYYRASKKRGGFSDILFNKYARIHLISAFKYFWKWRKLTEIL